MPNKHHIQTPLVGALFAAYLIAIKQFSCNLISLELCLENIWFPSSKVKCLGKLGCNYAG